MGWVDRQHAPAIAQDSRYQRLINLTLRLHQRRQLRTRLATDLRQLENRWRDHAATAADEGKSS